jgi:predicted nucleic acid-binding protein
MIFVDTNYFLRLILADVSEQHQEAKTLFRAGAKNEVELFTSTLVFFEICWVLLSNYDQDKTRVVEILNNILDMKFVEFENYSSLKQALILYEKNSLGLVDCFNLIFAKGKKANDFKTFDKKLLFHFRAQR